MNYCAKYIHVVAVTLLSFILFSCKKGDDSDRPVPSVVTPISAEFKSEILEYDHFNNVRFWQQTDTLVVAGSMWFEATEITNSDSVEWLVGLETERRYGKRIKVSFDTDALEEDRIKVVCYVYRYSSEGVIVEADTSTKSIMLYPSYLNLNYSDRPLPFEGDYVGQSDYGDEMSPYVVSIFQDERTGRLAVKNLIDGCSNVENIATRQANRFVVYIVSQESEYCTFAQYDTIGNSVKPVGRYNPNDSTICIDYWISNQDSYRYLNGIKYSFVGKKVR